MHPQQEQTPSPTALWQRHLQGAQAWMESGFRDQQSARTAVKALQEWLGAFPNQAGDVTRLALASATTALFAGSHERAGEFAAVVVDASAFVPLEESDACAAAAFAVLIAEECRLETRHAAAAGASLEYARALAARMDETGALRAWAEAQCELVAAISADALLERRQAAAHYAAARDGLEPLLRNPRRAREATRDWLRVVYSNAQQLAGQEAEAEQLVPTLVQRHYLRAALGAARNAEPEHAYDPAAVAAAAMAEFGLPGCTVADLRGALVGVPAAGRLELIEKLLPSFAGADAKSRSATAVLLGLRFGSRSGAGSASDLKRAFAAAKSSRDGYAWASLWASVLGREAPSKARDEGNPADIFLAAFGQILRGVRNSSKHLPLLAQFDEALAQTTVSALRGYLEKPGVESSARLSASLEARRTPLAEAGSGFAGEESRGRLEGARLAASDWLARIAHAVRQRPDVLVLIPTGTGDTTTLLAIADAVEVLEAPAAFLTAASELADAMARYFAPGRPAIDFESAGRRAYAALPARARTLLEEKRILLIAPDSAAIQSSLPYELLRGPLGFLGLTHVIARMPSLGAVAAALEPEVMPARRQTRAVCAAAPHALVDRPLQFAAAEAEAARSVLHRAGWDAPALAEAQLSPELLLDGFSNASLVHLAVHGEASGGAHAVWLPHHERVDTNTIAARRGRLPAAVYLSACSVGASEYLGGGVSRGLAHALWAKGAPAIVASQWPLEDAAAKTFAAAFYKAALKDSIGEAVRAARTQVSKSVSPALWASLVLIGNPWHRLGAGAAAPPDAATEFLGRASDPAGDRKQTEKVRRAASKALRADPDHRRLAAAVAWAEEFATIVGGKGAAPTAPQAQELAALAHDLGAFGGESLCWTAAADLLGQDGQAEAARDALDRAIDAADAASRHDGKWVQPLNSLLAAREKMDLDFEIPEIEISSGVKVNDRSDPAVRALLELQHAFDQREARRTGVLRPRLPEQSLDDLCWNAVVLGERNRFSDEFPCAGFCRLLAARATHLGFIRPEEEAAVRRVAAGSLRFLWSAQRMTHLERERAVGQAGTLRVALEALGSDNLASDGPTFEAMRHIERLGDEFKAQAGGSAANRFARARERLQGQVAGADAGSIAHAIEAMIAGTPASSRDRAHRAAWGMGYLLELAYDLTLGDRPAAAAGILAAHSHLESDAEANLWAYLVDGFEETRKTPLDPLIRWRSGWVDERNRTRDKGKKPKPRSRK